MCRIFNIDANGSKVLEQSGEWRSGACTVFGLRPRPQPPGISGSDSTGFLRRSK